MERGLTIMGPINTNLFDKPVLDATARGTFYTANFPSLMSDSRWRQYRLLMEDGMMRVIRRQIVNPKQLQYFCIRYKPIAVYQTISCWLNPELLSNRGKPIHGGYSRLSNQFLRSDYLIDLDEEHLSPKNLRSVQSVLSNYRHTIIRTGHGFHIWIHDWMNDFYSEDAYNREAHCLSEMAKFTDSLKDKGLEYDYKVSIDTRRIARVPDTLHQNGTVCRFERSLI